MKSVTSLNYVSLYVAWCNKNGFAPLRYDVLGEIFYGCETNQDFEITLNTLYLIQDEGFKLSFMNQTTNKSEVLALRLKIRLELFKRIPSGTNMLLAYNLIEELTLLKFSSGTLDITDEVNKSIEKFDKLKNLALSTKFIEERKLAFEKSKELFVKLTKVEI